MGSAHLQLFVHQSSQHVRIKQIGSSFQIQKKKIEKSLKQIKYVSDFNYQNLTKQNLRMPQYEIFKRIRALTIRERYKWKNIEQQDYNCGSDEDWTSVDQTKSKSLLKETLIMANYFTWLFWNLFNKSNNSYNLKNKKMQNRVTICLLLLACIYLIQAQSASYNLSLCADIEIDSLHYYVNLAQDNQDLYLSLNSVNVTYNLCKSVEVYCKYQNAIIKASMVAVNSVDGTCTPYTQFNISYLDDATPTSGIKVLYLSTPITNISNKIQLNFSCNADVTSGCPSVQSGLMWEYFSQNIITYTIVIEVIGIILMVFGIYIYRGSIVIIGWGTSFIILTMIQSLFVYLKGVPSQLLLNVLILTIISSFFVGYIVGYFPKAGIFCMGLWIGFVITLTLNNVAFYYINSNPSNLMLYIVMPVLSIGFGILILFIKKTFIIFASSLIGSYLCLRALSWNLGAFPNQFQISKKYHFGLQGKVAWQFYLYVIALFILTASSSALQSWLFRMKMKKNKQSTNIEEHINQMENTMKKQREELIQIKPVFNNQAKGPRVLQRNQQKSKPKKVQQVKSSEEVDHSQFIRQSQQQSLPPYKDSDQDGSDSEDDRPKNKDLNKKLLKGRRSADDF